MPGPTDAHLRGCAIEQRHVDPLRFERRPPAQAGRRGWRSCSARACGCVTRRSRVGDLRRPQPLATEHRRIVQVQHLGARRRAPDPPARAADRGGAAATAAAAARGTARAVRRRSRARRSRDRGSRSDRDCRAGPRPGRRGGTRAVRPVRWAGALVPGEAAVENHTRGRATGRCPNAPRESPASAPRCAPGE